MLKTFSPQCTTEIQVSTINITTTGQIILETNAQCAQLVLQQAEECVASTLVAYEQKLNEIATAYESCVAAAVTTTISPTESTANDTPGTTIETTAQSTVSDATTGSTASSSDSSTVSDTASTTTDITTSTTQITTTLAPCGTFVKYDPINAPNDPATKGFAGGYNLLNLTAYVGYGNVSCNSQKPLPGFIVTNPTAPKKPGVYITCNNGEQFDDQFGFYLLNHPNLEYKPANSTSLWKVPGALKRNSTSYIFCYGRFFTGGRYLLGKVRNTDASGTSSTMFYNTASGEVQSSVYEVLTCRP